MRALIRVVVFNATLSTLDIPVSVMLVTMAHAVKHMISRMSVLPLLRHFNPAEPVVEKSVIL